MSTTDTPGELLQANNAAPTYAWGERAEHIRALYDRYPNMTPSAMARRVGCDPTNVTKVIRRYVRDVTEEELTDFQACKADVFDAIQHRTLLSITDEDLSKAGLYQKITAAAILEDKARLVRGQATSINVTALVDVANLLRQRMTAPTGSVTIVGGTPECE